jgi:hypothetical protein
MTSSFARHGFKESLRGKAGDAHELVLGCGAGDDRDVGARQAEELGEQAHQLFVRRALDRRRGQADFERPVHLARQPAGLRADGESDGLFFDRELNQLRNPGRKMS